MTEKDTRNEYILRMGMKEYPEEVHYPLRMAEQYLSLGDPRALEFALKAVEVWWLHRTVEVETPYMFTLALLCCMKVEEYQKAVDIWSEIPDEALAAEHAYLIGGACLETSNLELAEQCYLNALHGPGFARGSGGFPDMYGRLTYEALSRLYAMKAAQ